MDLVAFALAVVLLPVVVWLTFRGVRAAMKPRGEGTSLASDRLLQRRDVLGLVLTGLAFVYWHGLRVDALALLDRAGTAMIITALVGLVGTVVATVVLAALSPDHRRETLRACGVVFVALAPFAVFVVSYLLLGDSAIGGWNGAWGAMASILVTVSWLTLMPTSIYYAFRYSFRVGEAPDALLPLVLALSALVALGRSTLRVLDRGFVEGFPPWVGALIAFGGPITVLAIVWRWDLQPLLRSGGLVVSRRTRRNRPASSPVDGTVTPRS